MFFLGDLAWVFGTLAGCDLGRHEHLSQRNTRAPALALPRPLALIARLTLSNMLRCWGGIRANRARQGLSEWIVSQHAIKNALNQILTGPAVAAR